MFFLMKQTFPAGFSLNGELLMDSMGSETAFTDIQGEEFIPAFTLGVGQRARLVFGQDVNALKYFTSCGLQEGYEPFCVYVNLLRRCFRDL
jgi:ryanodine receptor 2